MELSQYLQEKRGRAAAIARGIGRSQAFVSQLANKQRPVPSRWVLLVTRLTEGQVQPWDMRPDDWADYWPHLIGTAGAPAVDDLSHHADPQAAARPKAANDDIAGEQLSAA